MQACLEDVDLPFVDDASLARRPTFSLPATDSAEQETSDPDISKFCPELSGSTAPAGREAFTGIHNVKSFNPHAGHVLDERKIDFSVSTPEPVQQRPTSLTKYLIFSSLNSAEP
jgi:hypothetical protein